MTTVEHWFQCPCCWEEISMVLELSAGGQSYVEDCEVCCRPLQITFEVDDATFGVATFQADPA